MISIKAEASEITLDINYCRTQTLVCLWPCADRAEDPVAGRRSRRASGSSDQPTGHQRKTHWLTANVRPSADQTTFAFSDKLSDRQPRRRIRVVSRTCRRSAGQGRNPLFLFSTRKTTTTKPKITDVEIPQMKMQLQPIVTETSTPLVGDLPWGSSLALWMCWESQIIHWNYQYSTGSLRRNGPYSIISLIKVDDDHEDSNAIAPAWRLRSERYNNTSISMMYNVVLL